MAVILNESPDTNSSTAWPEAAGTLASRGYFRQFDENLAGLAPLRVVVFEQSGDSIAQVIGRYERVLDSIGEVPTASNVCSGDLEEMHARLIDVDHRRGVLARLVRLQDDADYWRIKYEDLLASLDARQPVAARGTNHRPVGSEKRSRIGSNLRLPIRAARRLRKRRNNAD